MDVKQIPSILSLSDFPVGLGGCRNDGNHFSDITQSAGIYSSKIGFGLGVTIADINKDGWQDIYVSNDFNEEVASIRRRQLPLPWAA